MQYPLEELQRILQPGDILLVHGSSWTSKMIQIVTKSYWNHAILFVGDGNLVQSTMMYGQGTIVQNVKGGVQTAPLGDMAAKDIAIYRHKTAKKTQLKIACEYALKQKGSGYDILGIVELAWLLISGKRGTARTIGTKNQYICSELVAAAYKEAGLPITEYPPDQTSPADIDLSPKLKRL
jgi:uncharacterized protein YycO